MLIFELLIDMTRGPEHCRYGIEFWVAKLVMGTSTYQPLSANGVTCYLSSFTSQQLRPPKLTFHPYLRALTGQLIIAPALGQTASKNGATQDGPFTVLPAEGWVSITVHDSVDPYSFYGYQPWPFGIYASTGASYLLACPALMGGITEIDDNIGIIAGNNSWRV